MNTELEGVLDLLLGGLEDLLRGVLVRFRVGVRVLEAGILERDLDRDRDREWEFDGDLLRDREGLLEGEGRRDRVELAEGHRKVPVLPGPTKRVQDPRIGPDTVPAKH